MDIKELINKEFSTAEAQFCLTTKFDQTKKSIELAKQIREVGNEMYTECKHSTRMHERIWDSYLCSIALAPNGSEALALSYGNMSALLFHLCKYEDCIKNIDKALKITDSTPLKVKLLCRKAKCLGALGVPEKYSLLEEAKTWLMKIDDNDEKKKELTQLVTKAESVLVKNKVKVNSQINTNLVKNKKKKKKKKGKEGAESEHLEILAQKEAEGIFNSVAISQDETYGRHLIATRDIEPGEIIFVAKPYILVPNFKKSQNFCNSCLRVVWSGIPCDNCASCIYCSEECHSEASERFHDMECNTLQFVLFGDSPLDYQIQASMRAIIMAVKEFGTIAKLRDEINSIDNCTDDNGKFSKDGQFDANSFTSLFGFKNIYVEPKVLTQLAKSCCRAVIGLAKFTSFFESDCNFNTTEDFVKNEDAIFISTLLLRVAIIVRNNGIKVAEQGVSCKNDINQTTCASSIPCCERGYALNTLSNLIPHSCNPNVKSIKTEGGKDLWYALQPIYKGYPLVECYGSTFFEQELAHRFEVTAQILNRNCNCVACVENWPPVLCSDGQAMSYDDLFKIVIESREYDSEKQAFINLVSVYGLHHQKIVHELSKILNASYEYFGQPSIEVCAAICLLHYAFDGLYGIKLNMPDKCRSLEKSFNKIKI